ncbi:hypothetical protein CR513_26247, partial [Mucuna pruriens]
MVFNLLGLSFLELKTTIRFLIAFQNFGNLRVLPFKKICTCSREKRKENDLTTLKVGDSKKNDKHKKYSKEENNEIVCFKCKKPSHRKIVCPKLKKRQHHKKEKSLLTTWQDLDRNRPWLVGLQAANSSGLDHLTWYSEHNPNSHQVLKMLVANLYFSSLLH